MFLCRFCVIMSLVMKMDKKKELPNRKDIRLKQYDYSSAGAYFVTICTESRRQILSYIVGGDVLDAPKNVELSPYGKTAEKYIAQLNDFYDDVKIDRYVIMPNHIHIMLFVSGNGASRLSLRLGHARVLTPHCGVIHCAHAASLPPGGRLL